MRHLSVVTFLALTLSMLFSAVARTEEAPNLERVPITQLIMRDHIVMIDSDSQGVLYSIRTKQGTLLDADLRLEQLQAKYPEIYQKVRPAIASNDANETIIPWAGMYMQN
jgi:hypothetical protein